MVAKLDEQINQLNQLKTDIESQRSIRGDETVEALQKPFLQKSADLEAEIDPPSTDVFVNQRKRLLDRLEILDFSREVSLAIEQEW